MLLIYPVLLRKSDSQNISMIWIPDLKKPDLKKMEISGDEFKSSKKSLRKFLEDKIKERLKELQAENKSIPEPSSSEKFINVQLNEHDIWVFGAVNFDLKKGFFAKYLPYIGFGSNIISTVCGSVITTLAIQLATIDVADAGTSKGLGISSSLFGGIIAVIIYLYSPTGTSLARIGQNLDNFLRRGSCSCRCRPCKCCRSKSEEEEHNENDEVKLSCCSTAKIILAKIALNGVVVANTTIGSIGIYQELDALGERARDKKVLDSEEFFITVKWLMLLLGGFSALSLAGSFAERFLDDYIERLVTAQRQQLALKPTLIDEEKELKREPVDFTDAESEEVQPIVGKNTKTSSDSEDKAQCTYQLGYQCP